MKQLIYVSRPSHELDPEVITDILTVSTKKNFENSISGILICDGEYFVQCFEGDEKAVDQLYANICKDIRHCDIKLLGTIDIDHKDFQDWEMGYFNSKKDINKTITELTSHHNFTPYAFTFLEAKAILKRLVSLI
jgi:hypothetical protein